MRTDYQAVRPRGDPGVTAPGFLDVQGVGKVFSSSTGRPVVALDRVAFSVGEGEFVSLLGPSGSGKSTLLRMAAGLDRPTSGRMLLKGEVIASVPEGIGMVFQNPVLFPWRTVLQNVLLAAQILHLDRRAARARSERLLAAVGLEEFLHHYPNELSGGMKQRVALARALVHEPRLLLMDEPFAALDAMTREDMAAQLLAIWEATRTTVLFVTHSIPEAALLSDRVVVLSPRPARTVAVLEVPFPRPRDPELLGEAAFAAFTQQLRMILGRTREDLPPVVTVHHRAHREHRE